MGLFKGKIHWYDTKKKYGYVIDGYGNEYFFHSSGIKKARKIIINGFDAGDEVEFNLVDGVKGPMAADVSIIGDNKNNRPKARKYKNRIFKKNDVEEDNNTCDKENCTEANETE